MQDVAARAGVSAKTVSRVFRADPNVAPETRARVESALKALDYVPNMLARTFREGKTSVAIVAVPDIADPFFAAIVRSIDRIAQTHAHALVIANLGDDPEREREIVEAMLNRQMDALIIAPISADQSYLRKWQNHMPIVFIDREPRNLLADVFIEDDRGGAKAAVAHLIARGHRSIAFIGDASDVDTRKRRMLGYRAAMGEAGIPVRDETVALIAPSAAATTVERMLGLPDAPTAIFSSNSLTSIEVFPALQSLRRADIALVSFGDFPMAASLTPSVTVVDQDPGRLGRAAGERLFARLAAPHRRYRRSNVFEVELITRGSTRPISTSIEGG